MTDKQIIETLKNIKERCTSSENCEYCKFLIDGICQIKNVSRELFNFPRDWKIKEIERKLNQ